ncbi:DUF2029 domain-containing protein [Candidatus Bathyarchaeota archaeon]|nr:DUF2029 domain-containing protein [Candidatus Bathyarchaeota archaeon]
MSNTKRSISESYISNMRLYTSEKKVPLLIILGLVQVAIYLRILALDNLGLNISNFVSFFLVCFIFYIFSILVVNRNSKSKHSIKNIFFIIMIFSIIFRVILLSLKPTLSHDMMRFLWDGRLIFHGINPYLYTPESSELNALKDVAYFIDYEFKHTLTVYPPIAQFIFGVSYFFSDGNPFGIKLITTFFDLMNIVVIALLLRNVNPEKLLPGIMIYAWSPLLIIESTGNGHIEPIPIFFILLSLLFLVKNRIRLSSINYSCACLSKLFPILILPIFLIHLKNFSRGVTKKFLVWLILTSSIILVPILLSSGLNLLHQIFWYSQNIAYNSSIYRIIEVIFPFHLTVNIARIVTYSAFIVTGFLFLRNKHLKSFIEFAEGCLILFGLFLLFAPAVFQWYLIWLLPFIALLGINRKNIGWFYFTAAVILAYLPQFSFDYDVNIIALIQYLPLYVILILPAFTANNPFKPLSDWFRLTAKPKV